MKNFLQNIFKGLYEYSKILLVWIIKLRIILWIGKSGKAQDYMNDVINVSCNEVKSRVRSATAKHKGYESFDSLSVI